MCSIHVMDELAAGRRSALRTLAQLDINLVVYLDALLTEQNVTRAAATLELSQPAMSAALRRIRAHFDDPILVRQGRSHVLSPLGARLVGPTSELIDRLQGMFGLTPGFIPEEESREFVLHCSDHTASVIGPVVQRRVAEAAPGVRLRFVHREVHDRESPGALLARSDGALLPRGVLFDSPHLDVFEDRWTCIVASDNPEVGDELSFENMARLPWIVTHHHGPDLEPVIGRELRRHDIRPRVAAVVNGFLPTPAFVSGTKSIAVIPQRLADELPAHLRVRAVSAPFPISVHAVSLWWHPSHDHDPAHVWLRQIFAEAAHAVPAPGWSRTEVPR